MRLFSRPFLQEPDTASPSQRRGAAFLRVVNRFLKYLFLLFSAVLTAVLFKLAYPKPSCSWVMWLALAPFIWAVLHIRSFWRSFFYSWLTGILIYAGLYSWIYVTCVDGGGLSALLGSAAWLGLAALMALQFAVFGGSCFYLKRLGWAFPVLAAMGWAALEWLHQMLAYYALGFAWFGLGYSQWNWPEMLQVASFTGAIGISALVSFTGINIGYGLAVPRFRRGVGHMILAALVFGAVYAYGHKMLSRPAPRALLSLHAAVLQPNIDQYKKWTPEFEQEIVDTLSQLGDELAGQGVQLAVWPESVTPGPAQEAPYKDLFTTIAARSGAWQLAGSNREQDGLQYVSAVLFSPEGETAGFYDKSHLVPFGEYIPFERWIKKLFPQVSVLGELGSFSVGADNQSLLVANQMPFGQTICYESVFPQLWNNQSRQGAKFFVNVTNDAWFFDTDAPYQHLAIAVLRAVEQRRPVLRAANTGISAIIAPTGKILSSAALGTREILQADVALPLRDDLSFYTQWGDWFAWVCAAVYFTLLCSLAVFAYE